MMQNNTVLYFPFTKCTIIKQTENDRNKIGKNQRVPIPKPDIRQKTSRLIKSIPK